MKRLKLKSPKIEHQEDVEKIKQVLSSRDILASDDDIYTAWKRVSDRIGFIWHPLPSNEDHIIELLEIYCEFVDES